MKFLTDKLRTKSFWVALIGALTLIIVRQCNITTETISEIVEGIGGLLVLLGIVASPPGKSGESDPTAADSAQDNGLSAAPDKLPSGDDDSREE